MQVANFPTLTFQMLSNVFQARAKLEIVVLERTSLYVLVIFFSKIAPTEVGYFTIWPDVVLFGWA